MPVQKMGGRQYVGFTNPKLSGKWEAYNGLISYTFSVTDGMITYDGEKGHLVIGSAIYEPKTINPIDSPDQLLHTIKTHQQGKTDFPSFCEEA